MRKLLVSKVGALAPIRSVLMEDLFASPVVIAQVMDWIVNEISLSEEEGRGYLEELTIRNFPKDLRIDPQPLIKLAERTT